MERKADSTSPTHGIPKRKEASYCFVSQRKDGVLGLGGLEEVRVCCGVGQLLEQEGTHGGVEGGQLDRSG